MAPTGIYPRTYKKEKVGYTMIHRYIRKKLGRPSHCKECKRPNKAVGRSIIEYANISGKYTRKLDDWTPLCRKCHMAFDRIDRSAIQKRVWKDPKYRAHMSAVHLGQRAWNKGLKTNKQTRKKLYVTWMRNEGFCK